MEDAPPTYKTATPLPSNLINTKRARKFQQLIKEANVDQMEDSNNGDGMEELYMSDEEVEAKELARLGSDSSTSDVEADVEAHTDFNSTKDYSIDQAQSETPSKASLSSSAAIAPDALSIPISNLSSKIKTSSKKMPRTLHESDPDMKFGEKRRRKGGKVTEYIDRNAAIRQAPSADVEGKQIDDDDDDEVVKYVTETRWDGKRGGEFQRTRKVRLSRGKSRGDWGSELGW